LETAAPAAQKYVQALLREDPQIDTVLLGCTHYALIENIIREFIPPGIRVLSQGEIVAEKLADYLRRHPEIERRLDASGRETFLTTEYSSRIQRLGAQFFGSPIRMDTISLRS
jgi:glutamate racemase